MLHQLGQTDDCVHRRADIMGHVGEKFRLCPVCGLRLLNSLIRDQLCLPQLLIDSLQLFRVLSFHENRFLLLSFQNQRNRSNGAASQDRRKHDDKEHDEMDKL